MKKNPFPFLFAIPFATASLAMETPFEYEEYTNSNQEIEIIEDTSVEQTPGEYALIKAEEDLKTLFERARKTPETIMSQELLKFFGDKCYKSIDEGVYYYTLIEVIITKEIAGIANVMSLPHNTPEEKKELLKDFKAYTHLSKIFLDRLNSYMELKAIF